MAGFGDVEARKVSIHAAVTTRTSKQRQGLNLYGRFIRQLAIRGDSSLDRKTVLYFVSSWDWNSGGRVNQIKAASLIFRASLHLHRVILPLRLGCWGSPWSTGSDLTWSLAILRVEGRSAYVSPAVRLVQPYVPVPGAITFNFLRVSVPNLLTI